MKLMLDEQEIQLLKQFYHPIKASTLLHRSDYSKTTFYRKLNKFEELGLIIRNNGYCQLTERGKKLLEALDTPVVEVPVVEVEEEDEVRFKILDTNEVKKYQNAFIYVAYPTTTDILKAIVEYLNIECENSNAKRLEAIIKNGEKLT
jgi:DNA-binding MarR family transcriptional regulator